MKIGQIIGLGVLGIALNVPHVYADGGDTTLIHGCIAKDGTTRVVSPTTACKSNETPTHWPTAARIVTDETRITNTENKNITQDSAITAIQTKNTQQDTAITTLQGQVGGASGGLVVKDSLGAVVGKVLDFGGFRVLVKIGNEALAIDLVGPNGFAINSSADNPQFLFGYTTNNCSGTRYFFFSRSNGNFTEYVTTSDGQTGYYTPLAAQELLIQSFERVPEFSGVGHCDNSFTPSLSFVAIPATVNLSTLGTPPFHLE
jgi:hypothetical protein